MADELVHDILRLAKGFRNGVVYGAKIRLPHALVMTLLFRGGTLVDKVRTVLRLTVQHSWALGRFVVLYKAALIALRRVGFGAARWGPFAAGALGGLTVFTEPSAVHTQIVLYLMGRVATALLRLSGLDSGWARESWALQVSLVWGAVMWLHEHHRETLQPSLEASMKYLYDDSERTGSDMLSFLLTSGATP